MKSKKQNHSTAQTSFMDEISVDNFAGGGGASTGIELAWGRPVTIAINHNPDAILLHRTNHPYTKHLQTSVWDVDPVEVCEGRPVGLAWFSPDCKHFSKAKGAPLVDRKIRGLSWVILRWAITVRPRVMMMENVEEIQTWGPLMEIWIDGHIATVPDPDRKGETFDAFIAMLTTGVSPDHPALEEACEFLKVTTDSPEAKRLIEGLGYVIEHRELVAADYGAPTTRKRFVLVARCDGKPIVWPERTHAPRDSEEVKSGKLKSWRSAAEIIDWTLPGYSIFASRQEIWEQHGVRAQRPLKPNTLRRIIRGVDKFTIKSGNPFIVPTGYGERKGQEPRVQDLANPLGTVVAKDKFTLCQPVVAPFGVECNHSGGGHIHNLVDPLNTVTGKHTGGVAAPVMVPFVTQQKFSNPAQDATAPLSTITAVGAHQVVEQLLVPATFSNTGGSVGDSVAGPVHTIRTAGGQVLASANLMSIGQTGGGDRIRDMREPIPTTVSKQECCAVAANLIQYHTEQTESVRGQGMEDPVMTVDSSNRYGLASCNLVEYYGNGNPIDVTDPLHTVTAHDREGVVSAHIQKFFGGVVGEDAREPLPTVTTVDHNALAAVHIEKYFAGGYKGCGDSADAPLSTVTVEPRHGACAAHVVEFKGQDIGQSANKPLRTITASWGEFAECRAVLTKAPGQDLGNWPQIRDLLNEYCGYNLADDEVILLIIRGIAYYISDITLRMLTPRELYNAMSFPPDYIIEVDYLGNAYPKSKQVERCGNAVCPALAEAMVKANFPEYCVVDISTMAQLMDLVSI